MSGQGRRYDVIVVGAGLSGLIAALVLVGRSLNVSVIAKGGGYLHFTSGCVDFLGRDSDGKPVRDPGAAIERLIQQRPEHPYSLAGTGALTAGVDVFRDVMEAEGFPFRGDLRRNYLLPTAIGSLRPTSLAPTSMTAGDLRDPAAMLIVGFRGFRDFYPPYIAANLATFNAAPVRHLYLDVPAFRSRRHLLSLDIARALDDAPTCREVGRMVKANLGDAARVGFPAVLGLDAHRQVVDELQEIMGRPIFEIPTLPPSVPGIRINGALRRRLLRAGARVEIGFWVEGHLEGTQATEILVESAGQPTVYRADAFVLATGGIGGGGIRTDRDGALQEAVFGLPVEGPGDRTTWHLPHFLGRESQPISLAGIRTNDRLQPLSASGRPVENLFVTASNLPGWDPVHEGSGEGVALATGYKAAAEALAALGTGAAHLSSTPRR